MDFGIFSLNASGIPAKESDIIHIVQNPRSVKCVGIAFLSLEFAYRFKTLHGLPAEQIPYGTDFDPFQASGFMVKAVTPTAG